VLQRARNHRKLRLATVCGLLITLACAGPRGSVPSAQPIPDVVPSFVESALEAWWCGGEATGEDIPTATLFVAPSGSDDDDGRSSGQALATLQAAVDRARAGDVVWIASGVYTSRTLINQSGTSDAPIVITAAPGACVVLDGATLSTREDERTGLLIVEDAAFVTLQGLTLRNSPGDGILVMDSHHIILDRIHTHDNSLSGITNSGGSANRFRRIVSHDNSDGRTGGDSDGISLASGQGHHMEQCIAYRNSDDGIDTWKSVDSVVERCVAFGNGALQGDGNGIKAGGGDQVVNTLVTQSISYSNRSSGYVDNTGVGVHFLRNTAFANGHTGFVAGTARLQQNLALHNQARDVWMGSPSVQTSGNSWDQDVTMPALMSLDANEAGFLQPVMESFEIAPGALQPGETIERLLGLP